VIVLRVVSGRKVKPAGSTILLFALTTATAFAQSRRRWRTLDFEAILTDHPIIQKIMM
jgi:hypothetical protein